MEIRIAPCIMSKVTPIYTRFLDSSVTWLRLTWLGLAWLGLLCLALPSQAQTLSAPEAYRQMRAGELILVDVRTPQEWLTTGVPQGARLADMKDPRFLHRLKHLEEQGGSKPIALICHGGVRTGKLVEELEKYGFHGLLDVSEGMNGSDAGPGWLARGLPLEDYQTDDPNLKAGPLSFFERLRLARLPDWEPLPQD